MAVFGAGLGVSMHHSIQDELVLPMAKALPHFHCYLGLAVVLWQIVLKTQIIFLPGCLSVGHPGRLVT